MNLSESFSELILTGFFPQCFVVCIYFRAYIHLMFKHAVLGTFHLSGTVSLQVDFTYL